MDSDYPHSINEVSFLAKHFTIVPKPTSDVDYNTEAVNTLRLSVNEPALCHAVAALDFLRIHYTQVGDPTRNRGIVPRQLFLHGLEEYTNAIRTLSSKLLLNDPATIKSALLCCQMFMSIELALNDVYAAAQHFLYGCQIIHDYGTRPFLESKRGILISRFAEMPDICHFAIKLFHSCPDDLFSLDTDSCLMPIPEQDIPDPMMGTFTSSADINQDLLQARKQLAHVSQKIMRFLQTVSAISSISDNSASEKLVDDRLQLLNQLNSWSDFFVPFRYMFKTRTQFPKQLGKAVAFTFLFYQCLKLIITMALQSPKETMQDWEDQRQNIVSTATVVTLLMSK